ncbi:MAG: hypothetical protein PHD21_07185 [Flavobacteriales bacterium]|nr:hypothetical protein [Flavobacteriales bacterium]
MKAQMIFLALLSMITMSCSKSKGVYVRYDVSYMESFINPKSPMTMEFRVAKAIRLQDNSLDVGSISCELPYSFAVLYVNNKDKQEYISHLTKYHEIKDSICLANNDINFKETPINYDNFVSYIIFNHTKLNVVSDVDYDDEHPAGTSLNDVLGVMYNDAGNVVKDGYPTIWRYHRDGYKAPEKTICMADGYLVEKSIADFNESNVTLIGNAIGLKVIKKPKNTSSHNLTVTYTDDAGNTMTASEPVVLSSTDDKYPLGITTE